MSPADLSGTVWVDGREVSLSADQVRQALRSGALPGEADPTGATTSPATAAAPSPARERLMSDLEERGFVREVRFRGRNGRRRFAFDAAHEQRRIAVDYHGAGGGAAHSYRGKKAGDADKLNEAQLCGWTYLVCDAISVNAGRCLQHVDAALDRAQEAP